MRYVILQSDGSAVDVERYIKRQGADPDFIRFVRREALGEALVDQRQAKSDYAAVAHKYGFHWEPNADGGHVQYDYRANLMRRLVMEYARQLVHGLELPVYEVQGANMFSMDHPVVAAYASLYGDRLYQFDSGSQRVVMSYDASYPQFNIAARAPLSYRQLPFAHFSLADCYRYEQSGELMLLLRQRRFYMPDIHPYFLDIAQAFEWFPKLQAQILRAAHEAGRAYQVVIEVPSEQVWRQHREYIQQIPAWLGADVLVNILDDGHARYWIINVDYKIIDQLGQSREIGCIQVDVGNAARLGIAYVGPDGQRKHPVIIHSAIPGGIERYLYLLFDQYALHELPLWLQPVQLRLLPVSAIYVQACQGIVVAASQLPLRLDIDDRSIGVGAKIKAAHEDLVPHSVVVGERELQNMDAIHARLQDMAAQVAGKPFIPREWPAEISKRV